MAGLRLGYALSSDAELLLAMSKTVQPWNVSILAQAAGVAALNDPEHLKQAKQIIAAERTRLQDRLVALGLRVHPSDANYLLFHSSAPLKELLLHHGVQIRDCSNYHGLTSGFFRIAIKKHDENSVLLDCIETVLRENSVSGSA